MLRGPARFARPPLARQGKETWQWNMILTNQLGWFQGGTVSVYLCIICIYIYITYIYRMFHTWGVWVLNILLLFPFRALDSHPVTCRFGVVMCHPVGDSRFGLGAVSVNHSRKAEEVSLHFCKEPRVEHPIKSPIACIPCMRQSWHRF